MTREIVPTAAIRTERLLAASPRRIFSAFARPERLARWWGPTGLTSIFRAFEFAPGGSWSSTS